MLVRHRLFHEIESQGYKKVMAVCAQTTPVPLNVKSGIKWWSQVQREPYVSISVQFRWDRACAASKTFTFVRKRSRFLCHWTKLWKSECTSVSQVLSCRGRCLSLNNDALNGFVFFVECAPSVRRSISIVKVDEARVSVVTMSYWPPRLQIQTFVHLLFLCLRLLEITWTLYYIWFDDVYGFFTASTVNKGCIVRICCVSLY